MIIKLRSSGTYTTLTFKTYEEAKNKAIDILTENNPWCLRIGITQNRSTHEWYLDVATANDTYLKIISDEYNKTKKE